MWYQKVIQIFKIKDVRNKILYVLAVFAIYRLMANIPIPGIDKVNLLNFFNQFQVFQLMSAFTGGSLDSLSIVMLGLGPFITAIIIFQLLTMIFPALERLYKEEGEAGRQKFNQYARIGAVPLALLQGFGMLTLLQRSHAVEFGTPFIFAAALLTVTAGSMLLMFLGELVTEKGIGNGVSLLIFAGIVADFPKNILQLTQAYTGGMFVNYILFFIMSVVIIAAVVMINESRRNIPVSYAKRVRGSKMYGGVSTYLPLNINPAGVIPIIFALSILLFPTMIANFLRNAGGWIGSAAQWFEVAFASGGWAYGITYFLLIVIFTYFYTAVTFDPKNIAENMQKMGGFVPGIRPGAPTANFLYFILNRVLLVGAIFLGLIAVMPQIVGALTGVQSFRFLIGGTSLLIAVSVVLETVRQINAQLQMREYETF
jgi:preprotein translocase subunit SecY